MVKCSNITCKYRDDKTDKCKIKNINLEFHMNKEKKWLECTSYEENEEHKEIMKEIKNILWGDKKDDRSTNTNIK